MSLGSNTLGGVALGATGASGAVGAPIDAGTAVVLNITTYRATITGSVPRTTIGSALSRRAIKYIRNR